MRRSVRAVLVVAVVALAAPAAASAADTARYILPPGNFGGIPLTTNSLDQLPLYDALTPLRGNVTAADINKNFLPEDFNPIGATHEEQTGRPGLKLIYDSYGIPHVYGQTRADMAFGAGWATARDRGLLIQLGRYPARVAVADVPGINAFGLVTSAQNFVPSPQTENLVEAAEEPARLDLRRQGPPDPGRRTGLRRRHQRLLEGQQHQPGARDRQRRDRGDRLHRVDLRGRRRR